MNRTWRIWLGFSGSLALVAGAVGWLSLRAINVERAEQAGRQQAKLEENVRLALWRMDSALSVFLAQENARPFEAYTGRAMFQQSHPRSAAAAERVSPLTKLPFQVGPTGAFTSPGVTAGRDATDADEEEPDADRRESVDALHGKTTVDRLLELQRLTSYQQLLAALSAPDSAIDSAPMASYGPIAFQANVDPGLRNMRPGNRDADEFRNRSQVLSQNSILSNNIGNGVAVTMTDDDGSAVNPTWRNRQSSRPIVGILAPVVIEREIILARQARFGGQTVVQGTWIEWSALRGDLQSQIADLLPAAQLEIIPPDPVLADEGRRLALLPLRIDPGPPEADQSRPYTPVRLALIAAWSAMALAGVAVGTLLAGVVALSERRADFVSAVTHELRTPLTTFRMYAEMLSSGMVPDEARRREYLDTLRIEADRLTHLVENVLAYARLERGGLGNRIRPVTGGELLATATQRLADRAAQAEFRLETDVDSLAATAVVRADPSAVEQILFNLFDNACKYAGSGCERLVRLETAVADETFVIRVVDRGPGFSSEQRRRLFQPFRKSADNAASTGPGVGLGLSLSRRLARDMGGELQLDSATGTGATLVLTLKLAK